MITYNFITQTLHISFQFHQKTIKSSYMLRSWGTEEARLAERWLSVCNIVTQTRSINHTKSR